MAYKNKLTVMLKDKKVDYGKLIVEASCTHEKTLAAYTKKISKSAKHIKNDLIKLSEQSTSSHSTVFKMILRAKRKDQAHIEIRVKISVTVKVAIPEYKIMGAIVPRLEA